MLQKLKIDFQVHQNKVIRLDPSVTVIIGPTDSGKSSIIRALRWLAVNKPQGDSFVPWNGNRTAKVKLFVDGRWVVRRKGKGVNSYSLDGKTFKAFGSSNVPAEIAELLNIGQINFARQHDNPFWFMQSPGEASRELNSIINLSLIDQTMANLARWLRTAKTEVDISKNRLKEAREEKQKLAWIKEAKTDFDFTNDLKNDLERTRNKGVLTASILNRIKILNERVQTCLEGEKQGLPGVLTGGQIVEIGAKRERLAILLDSLIQTKERASRKPPDIVIELDPKAKALGMLQAKRERLEGLLEGAKDQGKLSCELEKEASKAEMELHKLVGKGKCPVCGKPL